MEKNNISSIAFIFFVFCGCSEFNRPLQPDVAFSNSARDNVSLSAVFIEEDHGMVTMCYNGDLKEYYDAVNARFFLKERKLNEYTSDDLPSLPVDFIADIYLRMVDSDNIETEARMMTIGDRNDTLVSWDYYMNACIYLPEELSKRMTIYFWQIEFYFPEDTVRLPEKPGIWYFDREE